MLGLAIHTSSPELGLALSNFKDTERNQVWAIGRELSAHLHSYLADFLVPYRWRELTWLAVAIGPGGFTGTRIGVVAARTMAQQLNIPLFGISSLAAIAAVQPHGQEPLAVQLRAQRGQVFGGIYRWSGSTLTVLQRDRVFTQESWGQHLQEFTPCRRVKAEGGLAHTAPQMLELALDQWQAGQRPSWREVLPYYGQHPVEG